MSDSEDDDDVDVQTDEACPLPIFVPRDATSEPAYVDDLTYNQAQVISLEDQNNDAAIRLIVEESSNYIFDWKKERSNFTGRRENFTEAHGPTTPVTDETTVLDVFRRMFDSEFIDLLCRETNKYADQKITLLKAKDQLTSNSRLHRWTPTDRDEMLSFLAIFILQGLYHQVEEESYFSFNGFGTMPYFARIMSYNRFLLLKQCLHFVDNESFSTTMSPNKLCKIQPVVDYFNSKFTALYMPAQNIAIDESLLKWQGRLSFAQKISSKAAGVGVKTYELCESATGYLWRFFVYAGKNKITMTENENDCDRPDLDPNDKTSDRPDPNVDTSGRPTDEPSELATNRPSELPTDRPDDNDDQMTTMPDRTTSGTDDRPSNATAKIVYDLVEPLLHRGHTLIMDNFYNSPLLLRCLKREKTDCYGTLRVNREFVPDSIKTLTKCDLRQGEVLATYSSDLSLMVWRDANLVSMISTYHHLQVGTHDKYNRVAYKPQIVLDYNKSMGGVDRKDQFLSAQPIERARNKVWYKKLFRRLFSTAIFNCFVIFASHNRNITHRQFRIILAEELLRLHRQVDLTREPRLTFNRPSMGQMAVTNSRQSDTSKRPMVEHDHFAFRTEKAKFRCWMCAQRKVDRRTVFTCIECNVSLCIDVCFRAYHKGLRIQ